MDIRKIKKLIELLDETGISEIEIKEGEESVRLSRHNYNYAPEPMHHHGRYQPSPPAAPAAPVETKAAAVESAGHKVKAPMVGTLYTSPSPDAAPFVSIGQTVKAGDTLCIIEAMKMFNEIESDRAGVITAVHVVNGSPVEYDQPLFTVE